MKRNGLLLTRLLVLHKTAQQKAARANAMNSYFNNDPQSRFR